MTANIKKFKARYTDENGVQQEERPRLMFTADGKHKSLWIGDQTILATVLYDESDVVLWSNARAKFLSFGKHKDIGFFTC